LARPVFVIQNTKYIYEFSILKNTLQKNKMAQWQIIFFKHHVLKQLMFNKFKQDCSDV